ncbi:glycoside hydrolase family 18 protein [Paenibacillus sp. F411]|uniref:glycoside hydrolase family 18 protein n=1 Tax=Paenibacillus sp. F411 TaxID=2820239 RepID=UPI001AAF7CB0|nr:glycoside hydrolase family 18 protein [Paenibacillus sp. F411]MBO2944663.1 glycoside hydrolase family 18 protein [Paenibacillus sp. F411]
MSHTYIAAGYASDHVLADITPEDLQKLTHLNVAFGHVKNDEITIRHLKNTSCIQDIKAAHPHLTLLLSVGGWSAGGFSEAASTTHGREAMAASAVRALEELPFDGIDLDWEYPCYGEADIESRPEDKQNFTLLLKRMREALDQKGAQDGRHYLLTIAAGADQYYVDGTEMEQVQQYLDFVQLMTYDMRGGFQVLTGHHSNLFTPTGDLFRISVEASVRLFHQAGVPKEKMVIGAAFYSRVWNGVPDRNHGLHQIAESTGGYGPDFTTLAGEYIDHNGYVRYWDEEACAPYLFNGSRLISYDDEESIRHKCRFVQEQDLAGIMFWEYSCDRTGRLLHALHEGLKS